jgi:hypothetical protein
MRGGIRAGNCIGGPAAEAGAGARFAYPHRVSAIAESDGAPMSASLARFDASFVSFGVVHLAAGVYGRRRKVETSAFSTDASRMRHRKDFDFGALDLLGLPGESGCWPQRRASRLQVSSWAT